jgi:hypothetical protein
MRNPVITLGLQADGYIDQYRWVSRRLRASVAATLAIGVIGIVTPSVGVAASSSWTIVSSPNAAGVANYLNAAACATASDCWAVGDVSTSTNYQTLTEHYDGTAWSVVGSPNGTSTDTNQLFGVACGSTTNCWAVGAWTGLNGITSTLIEHYDGSAWSVVSSPDVSTVGGNGLQAVTCLSDTDCWATGHQAPPQATLIEHYNGTAWSVVMSPPPTNGQGLNLDGVTCASASDCWAVGALGTFCPITNPNNPCIQTLIEHYDGTQWSLVSSPKTTNPAAANNYLYGVSCASSAYCVAAGYTAGVGYQDSLIEQNTGSGWSVVSSPIQNTTNANQIYGVSCSTAKFCVAAGYYNSGSGNQTLIEQSTGGAWTVAPSPNVGTDNNLNAVTCTSGCIAVGSSNTGQPTTLIEQYGVASPPVVPEFRSPGLLLVAGAAVALTPALLLRWRGDQPSSRRRKRSTASRSRCGPASCRYPARTQRSSAASMSRPCSSPS